MLREGLESENGEVAYEDFTPVLLAQYKNRPNILFKTFDEAMDEYFAYREKEKEQTQKQKTENARIKKVGSDGILFRNSFRNLVLVCCQTC